jgi:hypothetical protein
MSYRKDECTALLGIIVIILRWDVAVVQGHANRVPTPDQLEPFGP